MAESIYFSDHFVSVLKNLNTVAPKSHLLIFKKDNTYMMIVMDKTTSVHFRMSEQSVKFNLDSIGIGNLSDFVQYLNASEYSEKNQCLSIGTEKSIKGRTYENFIFTGETSYRMLVASPSEFIDKYDRKIIKNSSEDPLQKVATAIMTADEISKLSKDTVRLMGKVDFFALSLTDDSVYFMYKGIKGQQMNRKITGKSVVIFDKSPSEKLFPSKLFAQMAKFKSDFKIDMRIYKKTTSDSTMTIKGVGELISDSGEKIDLIIGCQESSNHIIPGGFDVIL